MGGFNLRRTPSPVPRPRPLPLILTLVLASAILLASLPTAPAFLLAPRAGGRPLGAGRRAAAAAAAAAVAAGPSCCRAASPPLVVVHAAAAAAEGGSGPGPVAVTDESEDEDEDVDPEMDAALERAMHTVGLDWGDEEEHLVDTQAQAPAQASPLAPAAPAAVAIPVDSPFAPYAAAVEAPSCHTVYYGGVHARSFWRQGREAVQVVVPVGAGTPKSAVRFKMESRTRLFLAVGEEVVFDREVAQPVFRDTSYWYFEEVEDGGRKAVVLELDKRLAYSNWPRLFPEDPDLSSRGLGGQGQEEEE